VGAGPASRKGPVDAKCRSLVCVEPNVSRRRQPGRCDSHQRRPSGNQVRVDCVILRRGCFDLRVPAGIVLEFFQGVGGDKHQSNYSGCGPQTIKSCSKRLRLPVTAGQLGSAGRETVMGGSRFLLCLAALFWHWRPVLHICESRGGRELGANRRTPGMKRKGEGKGGRACTGLMRRSMRLNAKRAIQQPGKADGFATRGSFAGR